MNVLRYFEDLTYLLSYYITIYRSHNLTQTGNKTVYNCALTIGYLDVMRQKSGTFFATDCALKRS